MNKYLFCVLAVLLLFTGCDILDNWQEASLALSVEELNFDLASIYKTFTINNSGGGKLNWQIKTEEPWLEIQPREGSGTGAIEVIVDRSYFTSSEQTVFSGRINIETNGGSAILYAKGEILLGKEEKIPWDVYLQEEGYPEDFLTYDKNSYIYSSWIGGTSLLFVAEDKEAFSKEQLLNLANSYFSYFAHMVKFFGEYPAQEVRFLIRKELEQPSPSTLLGWEESKQTLRLAGLDRFTKLPLARKVAALWWGKAIEISSLEEDQWLNDGLIDYLARSSQEYPQNEFKVLIDDYLGKIKGKNLLNMQSALLNGSSTWEEKELFALASAALLYYAEDNLREGWTLSRLLKEKLLPTYKEKGLLIGTGLFEDFLRDIVKEPAGEEDDTGEDFAIWWSKYLKEGFPIPLKHKDN